MSDRVQPGAEVAREEYERFKQFVKENNGTIRGNLGRELENAMREYRQQEHAPERLTRMEDDLATLKAAVIDSDTDGGTDVQSADAHTQTDADVHDPDDPPHPKVATKAKLDWLEAEVRRRASDQKFSIPAVRRVIDVTWGFDDRTADPMVETIVKDRLGAWSESDGTIGWGDD